MTLILIAIAAVALRIAEYIIRRVLKWMGPDRKKYYYKRLTAIVSPELHAKVREHVAKLNISITEYILIAITEKLKRESHG